jgi:hypothetical protein
MSWSFNAIGKPSAVAAKARKELGAIQCAEPEQGIKERAIEAIELSCSALPDDNAVKITACGSQSPAYKMVDGHYKHVDGKFTNNLTLNIEPIYGFVE